MANIIRRREGSVEPRARTWDPFRAMQEILHWDPFAEVSPISGERLGVFAPHFEVKERGDSYVFKADLPGVKEEDLELSLTGNCLTVSGRREAEEKVEGENYYTYERSYGSFTRSFTLPEGLDEENVKADLRDGVLTLILAKRPEHQPKKILLKGLKADKAGKA